MECFAFAMQVNWAVEQQCENAGNAGRHSAKSAEVHFPQLIVNRHELVAEDSLVERWENRCDKGLPGLVFGSTADKQKWSTG
jgi:hypothetical protein